MDGAAATRSATHILSRPRMNCMKEFLASNRMYRAFANAHMQDFNCLRCPGLHRTILLGLLSFFGSVALILFTTIANLSEGFGQPKPAPAKSAQTSPHMAHTDGAASRVELGDVIKVRTVYVGVWGAWVHLDSHHHAHTRDMHHKYSTRTA